MTKMFNFSIREEYSEDVSKALENWSKNGSSSVKICQAIIRQWKEENEQRLYGLVEADRIHA